MDSSSTGYELGPGSLKSTGMSEPKLHQTDQYKGWLNKWTNYLKGYQRRWFVLQNGLLSYYRTQAEMAHTCRGTINLANAFIHTEDSCTFVITNGGTQSFHLRASSEVERQKWVTALELAKAKAIQILESDSDDDENQPDKTELVNTVNALNARFGDLSTCYDLIVKQGAAFQRALNEHEQIDSAADSTSKIKAINERATLFRIASNAMLNACSQYLKLAQNLGKRWQKLLQNEHEQRLKLEEMVEQLAKQQASLEKQARKSLHAVNSPIMENDTVPQSSDEDEFFEAVEHQVEEFSVALPYDKTHRRTGSGVSIDSLDQVLEPQSSSESDGEDNTKEARVVCAKSESSPKRTTSKDGAKCSHRRNASQDKNRQSSISESSIGQRPRVRRKAILERPNYSLNLWSIMKNCIGKELSKIPMPVNFNEPLSMLQRLTEDFEYSECLDQAARCELSAEQMAYVAAFTISSYSTTTNRTSKPFNPLLGETYECDRTDDYGWRALAEQVSHHPPMCAQYTEGRGWRLWQEFTMMSKFRGKYLQIIPMGISHLEFTKTGDHYTWRKVTTTVHNIIVGRLWVDNHGEMDITNHTTGDKCHLKYSAYSYFSRETPRKVTGVVTNSSGKAQWVLTGTWDDKMEGAQVINVDESKGKPVFETGPHRYVWKRRPPPNGSERMYYFTQLALELNEPEENVASTDSRNRPDQRLMEDGRWEEANKVKVMLEDKQRMARRRREAEAEASLSQDEGENSGREYVGYEPIWFKKETDKITGNLIHMYKGNYWEYKDKQDWSMCPDIYLSSEELAAFKIS
ncbi:oxysterol-binding protein 1 isoform X4 [Octopus sinensis]|uniref:Oxysterol-binding protein n=1 Tax=Octopus sinensis TaxID=2607531 RepID=A0A6P7TCU0_9MOLL|nr:oxysterol-binding protein 1 isoform X4 [Octopus sinensis]